LVIPRVVISTLLMPKLVAFAHEHPEVVLDISTSNNRMDIVAAGYDAGIQIGEYIQRDMIAVRVSDDGRLAAFGSPEYFASHPIPKTPRDLKHHACIAFKFSTGVYRWEFEKGRQSLTVNPQGPIILDDPELVVQAALQNVGIGMAPKSAVQALIDEGRLTKVLNDWCPSFPGFHLFYPSRRNRPAALTALIRALRLPGQG
jgi:DNA-binding transcriptional LysR family regulator